MYQLFRKLAFKLDPETAHNLTIHAFHVLGKLWLDKLSLFGTPQHPREVMGLTFPNPVGLAAGLDKDGVAMDGLGLLGFGFLEVGTVTPRPQPGNPKPRLFRLVENEAIINRMGFNNAGLNEFIFNIQKSRYSGVLGINIGKNKDTPNACAVQDYLKCLRRVYEYADYVTINISSPNTPGLRDLQHQNQLAGVLKMLKETQAELSAEYKKHVPLAVKVAPDLDGDEIKSIAELLLRYKIEGLIATNTTVSRKGLEHQNLAKESGGLSGAPLTAHATQVIADFHEILKGEIPIIASGGIMSAKDAKDKYDAGAELIQIYTGLIYHGPNLIKQILSVVT